MPSLISIKGDLPVVGGNKEFFTECCNIGQLLEIDGLKEDVMKFKAN